MDFTGYPLRLFRLSLAYCPDKPRAFRGASIWTLSVLGVPGYSWTMFGRKRLDFATGVTAGMVASSACAVIAASQVDRRATWSAVPFAGWVVFALVLQGEVWRRNR